MAINLQKGQRESINAPKFTVGLGWDTNSSTTGTDFDLDASVFILGENKKLLSDSHFVFYNNLKSPNEAVVHTGDNRTGAGDGDDEQILVDLSKIEPNAAEICIVVTIHEAAQRGQRFGYQSRNAKIRLGRGFFYRNSCRVRSYLQTQWRMEVRSGRYGNERWLGRLS